MKKAAMIFMSTCLFLAISATSASAAAEPSHHKAHEHKMHVKEHKMHAKEHKAKALKAKEHKLRAKGIKPHALPKTGNGGVSE